jgi:hypothetical protein
MQVTQSYLPRVAQPAPPEPETKKKSRDESKKNGGRVADEAVRAR